ncbi:MAG: SDR family oxidoreductase [Halomonas sp.]|uniref:SDR family oxidoreductase n=1 Tax=Halomonas sp. AOP42-C1-46 TaxID=3457671 RepID=UPI003FB7CE18
MFDRQSFLGYRVMISAGASGIGRAVADAFINAGAQVQVCDISASALADAEASLPNGSIFQADASNPAQVQAWFEYAWQALGGLDVLINNAGIAGPTAAVTDISDEDWDQCMAVNLRSHFLCTKRAVPIMKASKRASIINMSSVAGRLPYALRTPYSASKWGIIGFTQSLALELGEDDITVNAILPGIVDSERVRRVVSAKALARNLSAEAMQTEVLEHVALHRMIPMEDIAAMALFLASPAGRSISGQCMNVCAGVQSLR